MKNLARIGIMLALPLSCLFTTSCNERGTTFTVDINEPGAVSRAFRNIDLNLSDKVMREHGFLFGDIVTVTVKDKDGKNAKSYDLPYVTNYNEAGTFGPCLCNYGGKSNVTGVSPGLKIEGIEDNNYYQGGTAEIKMKKVDGFYETLNLSRVTTKLTYEECGYENTKYANCRDVRNVGYIGKSVNEKYLYRGSMPICEDNNKDRYEIADTYCSLNKITYDISLSLPEDGEKGLKSIMERTSGIGTYMKTLYDDKVDFGNTGHIYTVNLGNDWFACKNDGVGYGGGDLIKQLFTYMTKGIEADSDCSFYIHCNEGKDRTGFIVMIIEALCGVSLKDLVADYMLTFCNYYNISEVNNKEKYDAIANLTCYRNLYAFMINAETSKDRYIHLRDIDMLNFNSKKAVEDLIKKNVGTDEYPTEKEYLIKCATKYLTNIGLGELDEILTIKSHFSKVN